MKVGQILDLAFKHVEENPGRNRGALASAVASEAGVDESVVRPVLLCRKFVHGTARLGEQIYRRLPD
jgi:hypothetical protein